MIEPLTHQAFQRALIGGALVAVVCAVVGCYVILRRMAFLGDALSHAMLAGVTGGYLIIQLFFDQDRHGESLHAPAMLLGSILAGVATVLLVGFVSRMSRIKEDTAIGIMYTGIFALGGILASYFSDQIHVDIYHFVVGMVLGIDDAELWMMAWVAAGVLATVILLFRQLQITSFDPVMAASIGVPVLLCDYVLTGCTSLVVVSAVPLVGVILVVGMLVTPAATAHLLCDRLSRMQIVAAMFGITGVVGGLYVSSWVGNIAPGPSIVLFSTLQFLVVLALAPRYGLIADWLRRHRGVPQPLIEDVLGCLLRAGDESMTVSSLTKFVNRPVWQLQRAVNSLVQRNWMKDADGALRLTAGGRKEARRLLRAHRLWETYLDHVGTPDNLLHKQAHVLEHLHDEETVDYLDDKLGHPLTDPHGSEIPEDFVHLVPGEIVKVSLLRAGHAGEVVEKLSAAAELPIPIGANIEMQSRSQDGKQWVLRSGDSGTVAIDHAQADALLVRLPDDS